jgi:hypothetical protein
MDANRFDALTRSLHSRRRLVQTLAGLGAGLGVARAAGAASKTAAAGNQTSPGKKKKSGGSRFGCTKQDNSCSGRTEQVPCPGAPIGSDAFCVKNTKGKPLCVRGGACISCKSSADCPSELGPKVVCVKTCPICQAQGTKSACVVPFTPDMVP